MFPMALTEKKAKRVGRREHGFRISFELMERRRHDASRRDCGDEGRRMLGKHGISDVRWSSLRLRSIPAQRFKILPSAQD